MDVKAPILALLYPNDVAHQMLKGGIGPASPDQLVHVSKHLLDSESLSGGLPVVEVQPQHQRPGVALHHLVD